MTLPAPTQPSLFDDLPSAPPKAFRATVVRSHLRRVAGDPETAPPAPSNGTKTSRAAAEKTKPEHRLTQSERIFQALLASMEASPMGMTREQLAAATGIEESTVCARVRPMVTGADARYAVVEPGLTRIGLEGARQKVLWVAIERQDPLEIACPECRGRAVSRLFEVSRPSIFDKTKPAHWGYLTVRSCTCSGCWWEQVG